MYSEKKNQNNNNEDDVEEQKCTPVRSQKKLSNEQNGSRSKGTNESCETDEQKGKRSSKEKGAENEPIKERSELKENDPTGGQIVVAEGEVANDKVGVDVEADPVVAKTADEDKEVIKTMDQDVHSEPTEKKEKRKKKKKAKSEVVIKADENNAVGQICADDEMSFDEKKDKKKKPKEVGPGGPGGGGTEKKKKKDLSTHGNNVMLSTAKRQRKNIGTPEEDRTKEKEKRKKDKETSARVKRRKSSGLPSALPSVDRDSNRDQENTKTKKRRERKDGAAKNLPPQLMKKEKQEGFFKTIFNKAKSSITSKLNKSDDTFVANPDQALKALDVRPEYGGPEDYGIPPEKPVDNSDNNGHLFMKGRPFWCIRDEKPPQSKHYVMTCAMKDLTEGKWVLLPEEPRPKDLDVFHSLETMQTRDNDHFKKDKRILSNTIRSLVIMYDVRNKKKNNSESSKDNHQKPSITFVGAKQLIQYNRKNRLDPTHPIAFTPGIAKKVRKSANSSPGKK